VFTVNYLAAAAISGLTVSQGLGTWWGDGGDVDNYGTLTLTNCTLNSSSGDGALNSGALTLTNCTVTGNTVGGVLNTGTAALSGSTVSGNTGANGGVINGGTATLSNSTVTGNAARGLLNGGAATLSGSTVSNSSSGTGIVSGGTLTLLSGSTVSGNGAGGIFSGGTLNAANSTVSNNSGTLNGGGVFATGGVTLTSDTFSNNSTSFNGGGALGLGTLMETNCTFSGNSAVYGGGLDVATPLAVWTSTFSNNTATFGGGLFNGSMFTLSGSSYTLTVAASTFNGNSATQGGGIYNVFSLAVVRSTFSGNSGSSQGGGLANVGTATVTASTFNGNTSAQGSGIWTPTITPPQLTLDSSIVAPDTVAGSATGSYNLGGGAPGLNPLANNGGPTQTMSLQATSPARNAGDPNATDQNGNPLITDQRGAPRPHGSGATPDIGAYDSHGVVTTTHFVLSAPASAQAGQPFSFTVTAKDSMGNTVTGYVGTVHFTSSDGAAVLPADSTLTGGVGTFSATFNTAGTQALTAADNTYSIIPGVAAVTVTPAPNVFVVTSTADGDPNTTPGTLRWAVAQANASATPATITFSPSVFSTPQTIILAFTVYPFPGTFPLVLTNSNQTTIQGPGASLLTVSGDYATQGSSARVFVLYDRAAAAISGMTLTQCFAPHAQYGDAVENGGTLTLSNVTLSNNAGKGALFNSGALTATNDTVSNNSGLGVVNSGALALGSDTVSSNTGHGVFNSGALTLTNGTVSTNGGRGVYNTGTLTVTGSTVSGNAAGQGAGLFNSGSATVTTTTVSGNTGGGLYNTGALSLGRSTVSGNTGAPFGGGADNYGLLMVWLSTLSGNSTAALGGGINNDGTLVLTASTVSANTLTGSSGTRGSGVVNQGVATLDSTIVAADSGAADVWGGAVVTSADNLVGDGSTLLNLFNGTNGNQIGTALNPIDPRLGTLANNGGPTQTMALLSGSPAFGHGDANAKDPSGNLLTTDQRGFQRPYQGRTDVGAYEYQGSPPSDPPGGQAPTPAAALVGPLVTPAAPATAGGLAVGHYGSALAPTGGFLFTGSAPQALLPSSPTGADDVGVFTAPSNTAGFYEYLSLLGADFGSGWYFESPGAPSRPRH
jgi:hypothetical protein